jgi:hypothetical protein
MSVVCWLCARAHHRSLPDRDVFVIPLPVCCLVAAAVIVVCIVMFLGGVPLLLALPTGLVMSFVPLLSFRYQVIVTEQTLTLRVVRRHTFSFADVVDTDLRETRYRPELVVYLRGGRRITVPGMLGDFDQLVSLIESRMAGPSADSLDSVEKLGDRARIARGNRHAAWIAGVGIAIAVLIVWLDSMRL